MAQSKSGEKKNNGGQLGFEETLWQAADKMRGHMDSGEYKHVVLGLIFLKYISDAFEERRSQLEEWSADPEHDLYVIDQEDRILILEDRDEYVSENVFWVPIEARWPYLQANAKQPNIGKLIDDAMDAIEKVNSPLKGVLPKDYARPTLDKQRLGELIDLIGTIGLGDKESRSKDILGRVYEYFLSKFASAEGKGGGEFYTPQSVVKLLVQMIEPYKGRVYDPCCGSGGMFVQSEKFVQAHGGRLGDLSIYGQESNATTWRLAKMNLAIRGIDANLGSHNADTFHDDLHKDLKADFILANPPFNDSDWGGDRLREDVRWKYGMPPVSNANFAWVQHFIHHLAPKGIAGFVLANNALSSESLTENLIRKEVIENDQLDCIVSLPGKLFYSTPIPASLWFITRNKNDGVHRDRREEILFIDAEKLGHSVTRTASELSEDDINRISELYHSWKSNYNDYHDKPGFCKTVKVEEVRKSNFSMFPAQYVGIDHEINLTSIDDAQKLTNKLWDKYKQLSNELQHITTTLEQCFELNGSFKVPFPKKYEQVKVSDFLTISNERLGNGQEPEILTCTENAGLILQKERFSKRVATSDASKYKLVRKTDIVYNPYLLWAGAIDQCWIVEVGITSPAYEVLKVKEGFNPTLIGRLIKSPLLKKMYNGISIGTVQRRRRAPIEKFMNLQVAIPSLEDQEEFSVYTDTVQKEMFQLRKANDAIADFLNEVSNIWISGIK